MRRDGDDAVLEDVCWFEAKYTNGFDADVLVCGKVGGGVGLIGDGAGEDVGRPAASVSDVNERDFDLLERAVEVEIEVRELADAQFAVDADAGIDLFAGIAIGLEAVCVSRSSICAGVSGVAGLSADGSAGLAIGALSCARIGLDPKNSANAARSRSTLKRD